MTNFDTQRRWVIAERPLGRALRDSDFRLETVPVTQPSAGEVQLRTLWLGFDPAQKGFMENVASYASATAVGATMPGSGIGEVVISRCDTLRAGDLVCGDWGWQEFPVVSAAAVAKVPAGLPPTYALGLVGMTGRTAYFGLLHVGKPRVGDTLVVTGA
ncbi:MAG: hypothetical protein NZM12_00350, partial [Steroidobacteraceae bacterium]|nr:hypothetical protein [Steroidobacteraceae bacterium]